ncbi:MAG: mechanosensitive ion channel [Candidatus Eisenbacteria sp.]|nr:mechanosensitive ion channel [Candidatus Eisenbacteria bacterium]
MDQLIGQIIEKIDVQGLVTQLVAFLPDLLTAVAILIFFWILYSLTRRSARAVLIRAGFHEALVRLLVNSIYRFALIIFGLVMAASQVGINVGAALAGIGVAGIAIGFAAQDSLANTLAGFMIFWDKPFQVGDYITVAKQYGQVQEITMRTTRIRTNQNTYVVIPNKVIIDEVLVNHSKHGEMRIDIAVGIAYKESIPQAREVLLAAVRKLPQVAAQPEPEVAVVELGASSVNLEVRVWIESAADEKPVSVTVLEASKLALDAAGIEIPFPHMQLFLEDIRDQVWNKATRFTGPEGLAAGGQSAARLVPTASHPRT